MSNITAKIFLFLSVVFLVIFFGSKDTFASFDLDYNEYSNDSINTLKHSEPESFSVNKEGEVHGVTSDGIVFTQTNVSKELPRLQKFKVDQAWWYISDKGIIGYGEGLSKIEALSIYLELSRSTG